MNDGARGRDPGQLRLGRGRVHDERPGRRPRPRRLGAAARDPRRHVCVDGDAGARTGISMKGGTIVVGGNVGYMSGFMMQRGTMVVCGDAGEASATRCTRARSTSAADRRARRRRRRSATSTDEDDAQLLRRAARRPRHRRRRRDDFTKDRGGPAAVELLDQGVRDVEGRAVSDEPSHGGRRPRPVQRRVAAAGTAEVIEDIQDKAQLGRYRIRGWLDAASIAALRRPDLRALHALARAARGLPRAVRDRDGPRHALRREADRARRRRSRSPA